MNSYTLNTLHFTEKQNFICSIYLTGGRRYGHFPLKKNIGHLRKWAESLKVNGLNGIMFHNCFNASEIATFSSLPVKFIGVPFPRTYMSGLYRFELYYKFINKFAAHIEHIFFTDSTDLDVLKNPFIHKEYRSDKIYIGCEPVVPGNKWIIGNNHIPSACKGFEKYIDLVKTDKAFANRKLLNAGLIGGALPVVAPFIRRMTEECTKMYPRPYIQDMPILNYLAYVEFKDRVVFGDQVNTVFTQYEKDNKVAWFRHK